MPPAIRRLPSFATAGLALAAVLAGCGAMPPPTLPDPLPAAWNQSGPAAPPGAPVPELRSWWTALGDPLLDGLVEEALAQNLDIARAGSKLRQARLLAQPNQAPYLPSVTAGMRTLQDVSATDSYLHASLDVNWELGLFGRRESAQQVARAEVGSSQAALQSARVAVVAEVVHQYLALRAAQAQAGLQEQLQALDRRAIALSAVRVRSRLAGGGEADEAQARLARGAAQLPTARLAAARAAQALAVLLGRATPDAAWLQPAALPALGPVAVGQLPADLLRARPDVQEAEAAVLQAAGELGMAHAELYPRIGFGASYLYSFNLTQNRRASTTDRVPAIGPFVDIPLFDWGLRRARADARGEALQASLLAYRQTVLQSYSEAETALASLGLQAERLAQLEQAGDVLQRRARGQRGLLAQGLTSEYELLSVDRAALEAQAERSGAQAARALAFVDLYKALGGAPLPAVPSAQAQAPEPRP